MALRGQWCFHRLSPSVRAKRFLGRSWPATQKACIFPLLMMIAMKKLLLLLLVAAGLQSAAAQDRYWIHLADKVRPPQDAALVSPTTLANRQMLGLSLVQPSDWPVSADYIRQVAATGAQVRVASKWLNALSVVANAAQREQIAKLPFVVDLVRVASYPVARQSTDPEPTRAEGSLAIPLVQIGAETMQQAGLDGQGVKVGVIDAGFYRADRDYLLKLIFEDERVKGTRDLFSPEKPADAFYDIAAKNSTHGTTVMRMIGGNSEAYRSGMATKATYYLARTDDDATEYRIEEDYWIAAMEWMDSLGVRLINTSLGYSTGHTDPAQDYTTEQMDGKTTKITQAVNMATTEKGIIIVVSAGNEGNERNWGIVSAPADAKMAIAVGATDAHGLRMGYSSKGPEALPHLKPDVACYSTTGTSFSAPVITGLVACMLQKQPDLTPQQVMDILHQASSIYQAPNNYIGYGVPSCQKILKIMGVTPIAYDFKKIKKGGKKVNLRFKEKKPTDTKYIAVFHKKDQRNVVDQTRFTFRKKLKIKPRKGITHTTVVAGAQVYEIQW